MRIICWFMGLALLSGICGENLRIDLKQTEDRNGLLREEFDYAEEVSEEDEEEFMEEGDLKNIIRGNDEIVSLYEKVTQDYVVPVPSPVPKVK